MQTIEKELESDDEFPESCVDGFIVPVYLNDKRFEQTNKEISSKDLFQNHEKLNDKLKDQESNKISVSKNLNILKVSKGALRSRDIICLKCIENYVDDEFFLWFVNFLILKDLRHTSLKFLKSCLVNDHYDNGLDQKVNTRHSYKNKQKQRHKYRIIVK